MHMHMTNAYAYDKCTCMIDDGMQPVESGDYTILSIGLKNYCRRRVEDMRTRLNMYILVCTYMFI
jgi:hypothetical protein